MNAIHRFPKTCDKTTWSSGRYALRIVLVCCVFFWQADYFAPLFFAYLSVFSAGFQFQAWSCSSASSSASLLSPQQVSEQWGASSSPPPENRLLPFCRETSKPPLLFLLPPIRVWYSAKHECNRIFLQHLWRTVSSAPSGDKFCVKFRINLFFTRKSKFPL